MVKVLAGGVAAKLYSPSKSTRPLSCSMMLKAALSVEALGNVKL
jgi:hypothetical protein